MCLGIFKFSVDHDEISVKKKCTAELCIRQDSRFNSTSDTTKRVHTRLKMRLDLHLKTLESFMFLLEVNVALTNCIQLLTFAHKH